MEVQLVAGVPTQVLHLRHRGQASPSKTPLLVIIPGSPGMGHFYVPFASRLFDMCEGMFDVSVISHAGHSPGHYKDVSNIFLTGCQTKDEKSSVDDNVTDWYSLKDQIAHKLAFIEEEAKTRDSVILLGHSIGCWIILQMLKKLDPEKISRVFFLFPMIEKMAQTPNALSSTAYLWSSLRIPFTGLVWLSAKLIPDRIKKWVLGIHFHTTPSEHLEHVIQGALGIDEKCIYNVLKMAQQETDEVVECPFNVIDENIDKIELYYGEGDRWNVECCHGDMVARYPEKGISKLNIDHAFVERSSNVMAEYVHSKLIAF